MTSPDHQRAQELSAQAEVARLQGRITAARDLYSQAATLERACLDALPSGRPRSRGILAVSYAALLFKAALYDQAEAAICGFLSLDFEMSAREQLRELLQVTWEEQSLSKALTQFSGEEIYVALRGGRIGVGTAPAETAVHYLNAMNLLAYRAAEFDAGLELRRHGPPPRQIQAALEARATQPTAGSYRFSIRFVEPIQGSLFPESFPVQTPDPKRVSSAIVGVLRAIARNDLASLEKAVPNDAYRLALMRLARNLVPSGNAIGEVEVRSGLESSLEAVYLKADQRKYVGEAIKALIPRPTEAATEAPTEVIGILRALDLDRAYLEIRSREGQTWKIRTGQNELDDVIGPMVNRTVSARVQRQKARVGQPEYRLLDIDLDDD
jgi:hypothetical protein